MPNRLIGEPIKTESGTEPVTVAQVKTKLRETSTDNDTELTALIKPCRQEVERRANISIVEKTIVLSAYLDCKYKLPYEPVIEITTVELLTGYDVNGVAEYDTLDADEYRVTELFEFEPITAGTYKITYAAGMGTVPGDLQQIILSVIAIRYTHRSDELNEPKIREAINLLVRPYWIPHL